MRHLKTVGLTAIAMFLLFGCNKEKQPEGTLEIKCINPLATVVKSAGVQVKSALANPDLEGDTTVTLMTSMKIGIVDVWVSQDEVQAGQPDNLKWIRLTGKSNHELKLFEKYTFPPVDLPAGEYKSIKVVFRNIFYRYCQSVSDPKKAWEILETMGSWGDACDPNDDSLAQPDYFSTGGNFGVVDGKFKLMSSGEKVGGFTIEEGKKSTIAWRLGAGVNATCINYLIDRNGNLKWDCGIDKIEDECPPEVEYMWDFVVMD